MDQKKSKEIQLIEEKKIELETIFINLRIITLPKQLSLFQYYSNQNLLVEEDYYKKVCFYEIHGDFIEQNMELTKDFNNKFNKKYQTLFLENHLIVKSEYFLFKCEIGELIECNCFNINPSSYIYKYKQINRKYYITGLWSDKRLELYQLKNLKRQSTISSKFNVYQTSYFNLIVQSKTVKNVYYLNSLMSKQIRKYGRFRGYLSMLTSNYLFQPYYLQTSKIKKLILIKIYDICSMKLKGTLEIQNRKHQYHSYLYIKEVNILAILYPGKLIDFYDINKLEFKQTVYISQGYESEMKYDKENGLTLFQWRNIRQKLD